VIFDSVWMKCSFEDEDELTLNSFRNRSESVSRGVCVRPKVSVYPELKAYSGESRQEGLRECWLCDSS
jgi:hypothetical protein